MGFGLALPRCGPDSAGMRVVPLADSAAVIAVGDGMDPALLPRVLGVAAAVRSRGLPGVTEVVPAFGSVAVHLDPVIAGPDPAWCAALAEIADGAAAAAVDARGRTVEIPVCYGGDEGPDLTAVAAHAGWTPEAVVAAHAGTPYAVRAIGFAPGFPYLGGLIPALHVPRRATPRNVVPAGSVGIGGAQTGIYPLENPGGWNLIGRTPRRLFDPGRPEPCLLRMGDQLRFRAI
jgi:inhibitor of KinA